MEYFQKIEKWNGFIPTKFNSTKKDDKRIHTILSVDSEFQTYLNKSNLIITNQIEDKIYEHPKLGIKKIETWNTETAISYYLGLKDEIKDYDNNQRSLVVHLLIFYSATDILSLFNNDDIVYNILQKLKQDRRIKSDNKWAAPIFTGITVFDENRFERILYIQIHDASGFTGPTSLKNLALSLGVEMPDKDKFSTEEKSRMLEMYDNHFEDFIEYSLGDSKVLKNIFKSYGDLWENICKEMEIECIEPTYTSGSNTVKIVENIIVKKLKELTKTSEIENINKLGNLIRNDKGKPIKSYREMFLALNYEANYNYLFDKKSETKQFLALCDGGRCENERPKESYSEGVLIDIDISGAYASAMKTTFPIGLPTILDIDKKYPENRMCLGELLNSKIYAEFMPGLWYARVSTKEELSFSQDLILSKIPPDKKRNDFLEETIEESEELLGISILLTREIKNGVLTHDILQILKSTASDKELGELKDKVLIDSIIFYPKSNRCYTVEELVEKTIECDKGIKRFITKNWSITTEDKRSRYWLGLSMYDNWMEKLIDLRNSHPKNTPKNYIYKLVNNNVFGVLASPFFGIGNVAVSNNITGKIRSLAYLMAKGLGSYQSITDGGIFNAETVNFWNKIPSLNTLTFINEKENLSRKVIENLSVGFLGNKKWDLNSDKKEIAEEAWNHLQKMFPAEIDVLHKDGKGLFTFEIKHIFEKASFQSKANYLVYPQEAGKHPVKARGYELRKTLYKDPEGAEVTDLIPIQDCLERLMRNEPVPAYPPVFKSSILRVTEWKRSEETNQRLSEHLLPGDSCSKRSWLRPISLSMFRWGTWSQHQSWMSKHNQIKANTGYGVEVGFLLADGAVNYQEAIKVIQDSIDQGWNWYRLPYSQKQHPYQYLDKQPSLLQI